MATSARDARLAGAGGAGRRARPGRVLIATRRAPLGVVVPGVVLGVVVAAAVVGPLLAPDPTAVDLVNAELRPGAPGHVLGTDSFGRDLLARCLVGARVSLLVGVASVMLCLAVGGTIGLIAGYRGGRLDTVAMRLMDIMLAFPALVLALTVAAFLGPSATNVILAVAFAQIPQYARLARATALKVRESDVVVGARLLGAGHVHVVTRHVLPHVVSPLLVFGILSMAIAILVEASLSFLGVGVQPPTPTWGGMIADGRQALESAPHVVLVPGLFLVVTMLAINMLADGLRARRGGEGGLG